MQKGAGFTCAFSETVNTTFSAALIANPSLNSPG